MLHWLVLLSGTAISAAVATLQKGEAATAARSSTTTYSTYARHDREEDEAADNDSCYYRPPANVSHALGTRYGATNLQYVAFIQLSQLEKESLTLLTSSVMPLFPSRLSNNISPIPGLTLLCIDVVI